MACAVFDAISASSESLRLTVRGTWDRRVRPQGSCRMMSTSCEQYTHKYSTHRVAQHGHISSREHAWLKSWKAQDCTSSCHKWCFALFALPTSDRVVTGTPLHLLHDFSYEL